MRTNRKDLRVVGMALALVWGGAAIVCAQTNQAVETPVWNSSAGAGVNITRGNSKTMALNGTIRSEAKTGGNETTLGAEANYGEAEETQADGSKATTKNVDNDRVFAQYRRLLSERSFASFNAELLKDDIAGIDYRLTLGPGAGYYFLKSDAQNFMTEVGPAYITEELKGSDGLKTRNEHWALRLAERYERKLSATAKCWEMAEYLPVFDDFNNYLVNAEAGVEAALTARVGMRLVGQYKHNSRPAEGKKSDDSILIAGLTAKF